MPERSVGEIHATNAPLRTGEEVNRLPSRTKSWICDPQNCWCSTNCPAAEPHHYFIDQVVLIIGRWWVKIQQRRSKDAAESDNITKSDCQVDSIRFIRFIRIEIAFLIKSFDSIRIEGACSHCMIPRIWSIWSTQNRNSELDHESIIIRLMHSGFVSWSLHDES